jgi:hypothetical protein
MIASDLDDTQEQSQPLCKKDRCITLELQKIVALQKSCNEQRGYPITKVRAVLEPGINRFRHRKEREIKNSGQKAAIFAILCTILSNPHFTWTFSSPLR